MLADRDEHRRFILWSISRAVPSPMRGPGIPSLVEIDQRRSSRWDRMLLAAASIFKRLLKIRTAILKKIACPIAFLIASFFCVHHAKLTTKIENAYAEIERFGGIPFLGHPARIEFREPSFDSADLKRVLPELKSIPIGRDLFARMPLCRVLDFTNTRNITEIDVLPLTQQLEMTCVLYRDTNGIVRNAMTFDLQRMMMNV